MHEIAEVAPATLENEPRPQPVQDEEPAEDQEPALQVAQTELALALTTEDQVPALQSLQEFDADAEDQLPA